ncbi:hypothetical protein TTE1749 [Caldanaerobacter subterraneus subsp. tengcongensis MB4]|uniref:Uncharacterized protein n=1 Tax=Caldanaerobacter subterraneus subsp. tengcongensis (strain DSM 15242 / JCM 11007 / NBRC 100824 / MB4) TaxID=273068 RepID=Q8R976_CALS4|nr:hypothetical protein TTE1749 [Caldanaerobacter subterraneus subsp. tengcongensis MB4]
MKMKAFRAHESPFFFYFFCCFDAILVPEFFQLYSGDLVFFMLNLWNYKAIIPGAVWRILFNMV